MTDSEAIEQLKAALEEIRETPNRWGEISIIISGGDVKHVNVTKPPRISHLSYDNNDICN